MPSPLFCEALGLFSVVIERLQAGPRFLLRQCFHIATSQNQIGPILDILQQIGRQPAVDMAAASTEFAGLPGCDAETLPPHQDFQASRRGRVVFTPAGVRTVNSFALSYVTDPDGRLNDGEI